MIVLNTRSAQFGTVDFWRSARRAYRCRSWKETMRRFALQHGKAIAMLGDDSARIVERDESRASGVRVQTVPAGAVRWVQA